MDGEQAPVAQRKRRAACDQCNASKVKCSGGPASCDRCVTNALPCHYSFIARMGKPPGSRNKKTLERLQAAAALNTASNNTTSQHTSVVRRSGNEIADSRAGGGGVSMAGDIVLQPTSSAQHVDPISFTIDPRLLPRTTPLEGRPDAMDLEHLTPTLLDRSVVFMPEQFSIPSIPSSDAPCTSSIDFDITDFQLISPPVCSSLNIQDLDFGTGTESQRGSGRSLPDRAPTCTCFDEQARVLSHLRLGDQRHSSWSGPGMGAAAPVGIDALLAHAAQASQAAEARLRCPDCNGADVQVLTLIVMSLQLVFQWAKSLMHAPGEPCADTPHIRMGHYDISATEARILRDVLVAKAYEKLNRTLIGLRAKVDAMREEAGRQQQQQLWEFEKGGLRALESSLALLMQASEVLGSRMKQQQQQQQ